MCDYDDIWFFECPIRTAWSFYIDTGDPYKVDFIVRGEGETDYYTDDMNDIEYLGEYELWMAYDDGTDFCNWDWDTATLLKLEFEAEDIDKVKIYENDKFVGYTDIFSIENYVKKRIKEVVEKFKSMSFKEFKKWVKENFYDFEKVWLYQTKEEAYSAGKGVINMAKMVASEDILPDGWDYHDVIERIIFP